MKTQIKRLFLTTIIISLMAGTAHAQMISIRSDAVPYAAFAPNLGTELVTGNKTSVLLETLFAYHSFGSNVKALSASGEFRYWFHGRPMTREFLGASLLGATYKFFKEDGPNPKTYKGNVGGLGLTFGYVWPLGKKNRWNMELRGGIGVYRYHQLSRYEWEGSQKKFTEKGWVVLPYKIGFSFSYIIPTEKKK